MEGLHNCYQVVSDRPHPQLQVGIDLFKRENSLATDKFAKLNQNYANAKKSTRLLEKDEIIFQIHQEFLISETTFQEYFEKLTNQVMSPYTYDENIEDDNLYDEIDFDDDKEQDITTVEKTRATKTIHRFQAVDFLIGLETQDPVSLEQNVLIPESNQLISIDSVVKEAPAIAKSIPCSSDNIPNESAPQISKQNKNLLKVKAPSINRVSKKPRKPYTRKAIETPPIPIPIATPTPTPTSLLNIKEEKIEIQSCDMHKNFKILGDNQWLTVSQIEYFIERLSDYNYSNQHNNQFGTSVGIWDFSSVERMERNYNPSMISNNNRNQIFVLIANKNHYVILSNILFGNSIFDQYCDDDMPRTAWYMYDSLNNSDHAKCAQIALNKLFPDMTGYWLTMVKVQQQEGINTVDFFFVHLWKL